LNGLWIGLMSGTSLDGVDASLVEINEGLVTTLGWYTEPMPAALRKRLKDLQAPGPNELLESALAANALADLYAQTTQGLMDQHGLKANKIVALGAHGQTVRHRPDIGVSLQLLNGARLAQLVDIDVLCDFRSADISAGGQGAPLVPAFHQAVFGQPGQALAVLNLGGIANLSLVNQRGDVLGFDTGPANTLLDSWAQLHRGQPYDADGAWGASGCMNPELVEYWLTHTGFFCQPVPKSTGQDLFNLPWLQANVQAFYTNHPAAKELSAVDIQASLLELTAQSVWRAYSSCRGHFDVVPTELVVAGGGVNNGALMGRLQILFGDMRVTNSHTKGIHPQAVESAAFAWMAHQRMLDLPVAISQATGAGNVVISGAWHRSRRHLPGAS
jgi:anhydro-N-acetylmuramic acid kinase